MALMNMSIMNMSNIRRLPRRNTNTNININTTMTYPTM
jgi:hypothetical protein